MLYLYCVHCDCVESKEGHCILCGRSMDLLNDKLDLEYYPEENHWEYTDAQHSRYGVQDSNTTWPNMTEDDLPL